MAILITGGTGYIGRWLARELIARDIQPVAFDRQAPDPGARVSLPEGEEVVAGDITDRDAVMAVAGARQYSAIVHLAGVVTMGCEKDPDLGMRVNLGGTHNVLEAARQLG